MFKCCGELFEFEDLKKEFNSYGLGDGSGETFLVCPFCKGTPDEAHLCKDCGEWFTMDELTGGLCDECLEKLKNQYRFNIDKCVELCGEETESVNLSSFVLSMFSESQIEEILLNELRKSEKVDFLPFIEYDIEWFVEKARGVR